MATEVSESRDVFGMCVGCSTLLGSVGISAGCFADVTRYAFSDVRGYDANPWCYFIGLGAGAVIGAVAGTVYEIVTHPKPSSDNSLEARFDKGTAILKNRAA